MSPADGMPSVDPLADLARFGTAAEGLRNHIAQLSVVKQSRNYLFSVTVGARGDVESFSFTDDRYRSMAPAELGSLIQETLEQAQAEAREEVRKAMDDHLPGRSASVGDRDPGSLLAGMAEVLRAGGMDNSHLNGLRAAMGVLDV